MSTFNVCGIAKIGQEYKNIIVNRESGFEGTSITEVIFSNEYGEVEALIFNGLDIKECDRLSDEISSVIAYLDYNDDVQAVIMLQDGYMVVTDTTFFEGHIKKDGKDTAYTECVETNIYEDEDAAELIDTYEALV